MFFVEFVSKSKIIHKKAFILQLVIKTLCDQSRREYSVFLLYEDRAVYRVYIVLFFLWTEQLNVNFRSYRVGI